MMAELAAGVATAFWLGILTSISPCPLATNIAAISYIGRRVDNPRLVFLTGLLYTLGRTLTYLVLAIVLVATALSVPQVARFLQEYMHFLLGPILILVGMCLLGLIQFGLNGPGIGQKMQDRVNSLGIWGALLLGVLFALSFCPTSAALFFMSLIPLSLQLQSSVMLPIAYGIGTALPVLVFALLIAFGAQSVGRAYNVLSTIEKWARSITGGLFVAVGMYFCLKYIFEVI